MMPGTTVAILAGREIAIPVATAMMGRGRATTAEWMARFVVVAEAQTTTKFAP
jgi:hypothetical protein